MVLKKQNELCAICFSCEPKTKSGKFCIDHCHKSGKIRGLLCNTCNMAIGKLKDNIEILTRAIKYIQEDGLNSSYLNANLPPPLKRKKYKPTSKGQKINYEIAQEIRLMNKNKITQTKIANKFGISQALVSAIILEKTWKTRKQNGI